MSSSTPFAVSEETTIRNPLGDRPRGGGEPDSVEARRLKAALASRLFENKALETLGRFELRDCLGRGGMGSVYAAYDPNLEREVALKILHEDIAADARRQRRLVREAKAMARLSHPNVVTVHEVGEADGRFFIAMEYLHGGTLRSWCNEHPPGSRTRFLKVLRFALQAANGLVAAHAAGLVHRDLKPANVLLSADGRVCIADFGLARGAQSPSVTSQNESIDLTAITAEGQTTEPGDLARLTATGEIVGTPAYMAPEQFRGDGHEQSDQFGFCATFFEAFYGRRAHEGDDLHSLVAAVCAAEVRPHEAGIGVPRGVYAVLKRGLLPIPADRHASLKAVRKRLQRHLRGQRVAASVGTALAASAAVGGVAAAWLIDDKEAACSGEARGVLDDWARRGSEVQRGLARSGAAQPERIFDHVSTHLDSYTRRWQDAYAKTCDDATEAATAKRACLGDLRQQFAILVDRLADVDEAGSRRAIEAALSLPSPTLCERAIGGSPAVDAELARDAADAKALMAFGRFAEADVLLDSVVARAREARASALLAAAHAGKATIAYNRRDWEVALAQARESLAAAEAAQSPESQITAWRRIGSIARYRRQFADARFALERATGIAERERVSTSARGRVEWDRAELLHAEGKSEQSREVFEHALKILEGVHGREHIDRIGVLTDYTSALIVTGPDEMAKEIGEEALRLSEMVFGSRPALVVPLNNLAIIHNHRGEYEESLALYRRAEQIFRDHPEYQPGSGVMTQAMVGQTLEKVGRTDEAIEAVTVAAELAEALDDGGESLGMVRMVLAALYLDSGRVPEAVALYEQLLEHMPSQAMNPVNRDVIKINLALGYARAGRNAEAMALVEELETNLETDLAAGAERGSQRVATNFMYLGEAMREAGAKEHARRLFERSLENFAAAGLDSVDSAVAMAGLAIVLPSSERARALELAAAAKPKLGPDPDAQRLRRDLAKWEGSVPGR